MLKQQLTYVRCNKTRSPPNEYQYRVVDTSLVGYSSLTLSFFQPLGYQC